MTKSKRNASKISGIKRVWANVGAGSESTDTSVVVARMDPMKNGVDGLRHCPRNSKVTWKIDFNTFILHFRSKLESLRNFRFLIRAKASKVFYIPF